MDFCSGSYGACFDLKFFPPTSKTLNLIGKIAGAVGMVWVKRFKKILDWFLVKLQRTITFALVFRITIILYAFGVEFDFPPCKNPLRRFANSDSPENAIFYISAIFFVIFLHFFHFWKIVKNTCALSFDLIFFVCCCLTTQRNILPIFKSFGGRLSILVVIPFVMPISP